MIKVGIIGCGKIAQVRHIPEYLENSETQLTALFDFNTGRARDLAARYGVRACDSIEELLSIPDLDAVSICTANMAHAENTLAALEAGKHVLCEKPMATTIEDCERMVQKAREKGLVLMIDQNQRLAPAHQKARELIAQGAIGRVLTFRTTFGHGGPETWSIDPGTASWFFDRSKSAMGALADLGVHKTDLIQYLLNQKVRAVTARVTTLDKRDAQGQLVGVDDNAVCIYEMDGGAVGSMTASWTYYGAEDNSTVIYGDKGILKIYDSPDYALRIVGRTGEVITYELGQIQTNDHQTSTGVIDAFAAAILGRQQNLIDGADVLQAMRAVFACLKSSDEGRRIEI